VLIEVKVYRLAITFGEALDTSTCFTLISWLTVWIVGVDSTLRLNSTCTFIAELVTCTL
jgi:hypothetical protein